MHQQASIDTLEALPRTDGGIGSPPKVAGCRHTLRLNNEDSRARRTRSRRAWDGGRGAGGGRARLRLRVAHLKLVSTSLVPSGSAVPRDP